MATIVSVGSGKGGTGKSVVMTNIACQLAKRGKKVCLVDLDVGGANAHILFGQFNPSATLTDFLTRKVESLEEVVLEVPPFKNLEVIVGTGETLKTANLPFATKQRLFRHLTRINADIVLIDVGAGANYNALDFFMMGTYQICVTTPEPTATLDLYRFIKLAVVRKVLSSFVSYEAISPILAKNDFKTVRDIYKKAAEIDEQTRRRAEEALKGFHPMLVLNQVGRGTSFSAKRLEQLMAEYLDLKLVKLGEVPLDDAVKESVRRFMPVSEMNPKAPASMAFSAITEALLRQIA